METPTTRRCALALLAVALGLPATAVQAQSYPTKPITIIVPFPAGGGTDTVARVLAEKMGPKLGQNIVVDNKGGAAGILGTDAVAKAAPDGHTLVLSITTSLLTNQFLFKKLPYNPQKDLAMVSQIAEAPIVLVVRVPTMAEQGMKDDVFKAVGWFAIAAPAATPKAVQQRIADEVRAALKLPDVKAKIESFGYVPTGLGPEEFTALYRKELPLWEKAVKDSGATLD